MISYLPKKMNQNNLLFKSKESRMKTFPQYQYTKNLSGEEPVQLPEEKPVHLSPEEMKQFLEMRQFLANHPEVQAEFERYNLRKIVKEEVLKTLKK